MSDAVASALKSFLEHGLLGCVAILCIYWAVRKDRECTTQTKEHSSKIEELSASHLEKLEAQDKAHQDEMRALGDRLITRSETMVEKYHDLARELKMLVDAMQRTQR